MQKQPEGKVSLSQLLKQAQERVREEVLGLLKESFEGLLEALRDEVVGMGLHRGVEASRIEEAVLKVLREHGFSFRSIRNLATVKGREKEPGLLEFARKFNLPIDPFSLEELRRQNPPSPSAALRSLGVPGVCESAALLSSRGKLLIPKVKFRDITLAVARIEAKPRGKLHLIGLGPGDSDHLTFNARKALEGADVVIGYRKYLSQIAELIPQKEILSFEMGSELERAELAFELASSGRKVALVSGGDPGIYGMAGAFFEFLNMEKKVPDFEIEIIPGIPALSAASSLLGSPLSCDFACISLSDLLVPWEVIAERLRKAAEGELTDLEHLPELEANVSTIILIGNSSTFKFGKWMITFRGYKERREE